MKAPTVMQLSAEEVQAFLGRVQGALTPEDYRIAAGLANTVQRLSEMIENKNLTLARLRQMLFGIQSERKEKVFPETADKPAGESGASGQGGKTPEKKPGHGRNGAEDYTGARRVKITHPGMKTGCACPKCQRLCRFWRAAHFGRQFRRVREVAEVWAL